MLARLVATYGLYLALSAGLVVTVFTWDRSRIHSAKREGARAEQVRVEKQGDKTDAKAQIARKRAEAKPNEHLRGVCRDC